MFLKKTIFTSILALAGFASVSGQNLQEFFINTPDSLMPYVVKLDREALIKVCDPTQDTLSTMDLTLGGKVALTCLKSDEIDISPSRAFSIQYGMLPSEGDSVVCVITTYNGPEPDSQVKLYNRQWQLIGNVEIQSKAQLNRPDTMSVERFEELKKLPEISMVQAKFSKESPKSIILQYSMPMMSEEDKKAFAPTIMQTTLNWDGKTFN